MEKQNKIKKHGYFPHSDWRNEIVDALGIGFAAGAAAMIAAIKLFRQLRGQ